MGMHKLIECIKETERTVCEREYKGKIEQLEKEIADLKRKEYAVDVPDLYNARIEVLDLSVRTFNVLCRANLCTVKDVIEAKPEKIIHLRNLGRKSFTELVDVLKYNGFEAKAMELLKCYEKC